MYQSQKENCMDEFPVAMAYVPWQYMNQIYEDLGDALEIGTLFPELNKPFMRGCCHDVR